MSNFYRRKRITGFKVEATRGTMETLDGTNAIVPIFATGAVIQANIDPTEREAMGSASYHEAIPGAKGATITFMHHFQGSGNATNLVNFHDLLLASGLIHTVGASNVAYAPVTGSTNTATAWNWQGGRIKQSYGGMFNLVFSGPAGKPVECQYNGRGVWYGNPSNGANVSPTYDDTPKPPLATQTLSFGGTNIRCSTFSFDLGNVVELREDHNNTGIGYYSAEIANRRPVLTVDPEASDQIDFYTKHSGITTGAVSIICGSTAGNILQISIPVAQVLNAPEEGDRHGLITDSLQLLACRNGADDSEFRIYTA